jgi:pantoate--beta-alanine ligase
MPFGKKRWYWRDCPVKLAKSIKEMRDLLDRVRRSDESIGLVPTMGALHEGHLSLVRRSASENAFTVVSIFVNPTQFGPGEDYDKYPRILEEDMDLADQAGAQAVFAPSAEEMYAHDHTTFVEVGEVTEGLCGGARPGHFRGVTTVVAKLFNIVGPMPHTSARRTPSRRP